MPTKAKEQEVEFPVPECRQCGTSWEEDSQKAEYMADREAWWQHIFRLPTREAAASHVRQRCRWIYGTGQLERVEADVRAVLSSWATQRDLFEQRLIREARTREMADEGQPVGEPGTVFDRPQTPHEKFPSAFAEAKEPYGWQQMWQFCSCGFCSAKRGQSQ